MDAIYLVINGQSAGPFTLAQVRESLAKGDVTLQTPAWHSGLADWTTLGVLLGQVPAAPPPIPLPAAPSPGPVPVAPPGEFTRAALRQICQSQNLLMWSVLAGFGAFFIAHLPLIGIPLVLGIVAFQIYAIYMLASALRFQTFVIVLLCLGMFIPCVSLIILVLVSARASTVLRANGVRIGLMGGKIEDIKD